MKSRKAKYLSIIRDLLRDSESLTNKEICKKYDIAVGTYYAWINRAKKNGIKPSTHEEEQAFNEVVSAHVDNHHKEESLKAKQAKAENEMLMSALKKIGSANSELAAAKMRNKQVNDLKELTEENLSLSRIIVDLSQSNIEFINYLVSRG